MWVEYNFQKKKIKMSESQLGPVQFVGSVNLLGVITDMNLNTCD